MFAGFALALLNFDGTGTAHEDQPQSTSDIIFGNAKNSQFDAPQKLFASIILILLDVVLLNLFISMMGDSYDKVQSQKVITDAQTRLNMSVEAMTYLRILKKNKTKGKGYLIYCGPEVEDNEEDYDEWNGRTTIIKKVLQQNESKIQAALKANTKTDDKVYTKIQEKIEAKIEEKITGLESKFASLENKMKEQDEQMKKQAREMKEQMDQMKKELKDSLSAMLNELKPALKEIVPPEEPKEKAKEEEEEEEGEGEEEEEEVIDAK